LEDLLKKIWKDNMTATAVERKLLGEVRKGRALTFLKTSRLEIYAFVDPVLKKTVSIRFQSGLQPDARKRIEAIADSLKHIR
jgi:hypothetical protein